MKKKVLIVLIAFLLIGCGPRFVYYQLDWLIPLILRDYISLNAEQKRLLKDRVVRRIDWHCRTQLGSYSTTLRTLSRDISNLDHPMEYQRMSEYYTKFYGYWTELIRQVSPDLAELLKTATDDQIEELFNNLNERGEEMRAEYVDLPEGELIKQREDRMIKAIRKWLSDPTPEQKQAVAMWSQQLKSLGSEWMQYRDRIEEEVRYLLRKRRDLPDFEQRFTDVLVHPERMRSESYQIKNDYNTDLTIKLALKINHLMTPEQRKRLTKRIDSLAEDFEKIKCEG